MSQHDTTSGSDRLQAVPLPISIRGIRKSYGLFTALDDVSLDISPGEFVSLLGPSGSGKTTLLMVIAGFTRPDAGSLRIGEREVILDPPHKRNLGVVFQNYALFPHMNVAGNVGYPLRLRGVPKREAQRRITEALELVQLAGLAERRIDELSGGQRQRVALARAIVFEPRILLMDEPLSALDKQLREQMQIEIRRLHDSLGITTVYVTHDQREALTLSDRIAVMHEGRFMQFDDPRTLYERPANRFVASFVGESTFLPVTRGVDGVVSGGRLMKTAGALPAGASLHVMIRPEKLKLLDPRSAEDGGLNVLEGVVRQRVYQGDSLLLYVAMDAGGEAMVRIATGGEADRTAPPEGARVRLGLRPADTIVLAD